jgi:hypothetical protein
VQGDTLPANGRIAQTAIGRMPPRGVDLANCRENLGWFCKKSNSRFITQIGASRIPRVTDAFLCEEPTRVDSARGKMQSSSEFGTQRKSQPRSASYGWRSGRYQNAFGEAPGLGLLSVGEPNSRPITTVILRGKCSRAKSCESEAERDPKPEMDACPLLDHGYNWQSRGAVDRLIWRGRTTFGSNASIEFLWSSLTNEAEHSRSEE